MNAMMYSNTVTATLRGHQIQFALSFDTEFIAKLPSESTTSSHLTRLDSPLTRLLPDPEYDAIGLHCTSENDEKRNKCRI